MRNRLRTKLYWFMCGDWWWDKLEGKVAEKHLERAYDIVESIQPALCRIGGHTVITDHCGLPEHDYCFMCGVRKPGQSPREDKL